MKKILLSLFLIIIVIIAWLKVVDNNAIKFNTDTMKDVGSSLIIVRSINSVLSVVQNSSIIAGIGVDAELALGEVVNPINDFLDRFSWILLFSLISLGIQNFIISLLQTPLINGLLTISVLCYIFSLFKKEIEYKEFIFKFMIFMLFIRFATSLTGSLNGYIYNSSMKQQIAQIQQENKLFNDKIQQFSINSQNIKNEKLKLNQQISILSKQKVKLLNNYLKNQSYWTKIETKITYSHLPQALKQQLVNIDIQINKDKQELNKFDINPYKKLKLFLMTKNHNMKIFFDRSYNMIVLFLIRGVLFPLLFLWLFVKLAKMVINMRYKELSVEVVR